MDFISIFLIALGLAMDAFAVSVSNGLLLKKIKLSYAFKFGAFFGIFQFIMPILGWGFAQSFNDAIKKYDHWFAFILLFIIGGNMVLESIKNDESKNIYKDKDILSFKNLFVLAIATSIDALAVGISFALININIFISSAIIGIVAFVLSYIGVILGKKIGGIFRKGAEVVGGTILMGIGIKILVEHLFF